MPDVIADPEVVAVQWVRNNINVRALLDNFDGSYRCSTDLPNTPSFPFLTVVSIGGLEERGPFPLYHAFLQFDCYGARGWDASPAKTRPDLRSASLLARTLKAEMKLQTGAAVNALGPNNEAHLYGFDVTGSPQRVNEPTEWARYLLEATMTIREK